MSAGLLRKAAAQIREGNASNLGHEDPFALAVADWLTSVADYGWRECSPTGCLDPGCADCVALMPALAVARAYLGGNQ